MATAMAAAACGDGAASEVLRGLGRHLSRLTQDDRAARQRALAAIRADTVDGGLPGAVLQEVFAALLRPLLGRLSDPADPCREAALGLIEDFVRRVPEPERALPGLVPCLVQRLGGRELLEPAEELRLAAVALLRLAVERCGGRCGAYAADVTAVLRRTVVDPCPDVRRESCGCARSLAGSAPEHFHMEAESLIKPLMQTITHQHSRVRASVIEATGVVIQHSNGKNIDDVLSHLAQRLFDDSPKVRKMVTAVVGDWLLHMRDRYSYFAKLIPLLLSSINDEIPEIRLLAADLWKQVGAQWEKENEEDIKDKLDFLLAPPPFYPPEVERPGLGCRELVVRNLGRLVPAISHDLTDWLVATRVRTSQLLSVLLLHSEEHSTQHVQPLLATLYRACTDTEKDVIRNCLAAAKLLGTFVPPEVFLKLVLNHVTSPYSSSHPWAPLMVLAAMMEGCPTRLLQPHLEQIINTLVRPDVCQDYQQVMYLQQLLACIDVLLHHCDSDCRSISLELLQVLITVQSLSVDPQLSDKALETVQVLCKVQGLESVMELYRQHMGQLLDWMSASVSTWTSFSPQKLQLQTIVTQSGPVIGEFLSQLMPLLHCSLQKEKDPELRMSIFTMLAKLLLDAEKSLNSQGHFQEEAEKFLSDALLPNLVWRAGRTASAVRTAALSCLLALLHGGSITPGQLLCLLDELSPVLLSALEEDARMSRLFACRSVATILKLTGKSLHPDVLNKIYPELLKRLDDGSEEVRSAALIALKLWLSGLTKEYDPKFYAAHLQFLFQQLLLFLDDPDSSVQEQVLEVLKDASLVHPALLQREAEAVIKKQRTPEYCKQLLQHISSLPTETANGDPE